MVKISATHVSVGKHLQVTLSEIWNLITDTTKWPIWGPTVLEVESADRFIKSGSKGHVKTAAGIWLPFQIADYEERNHWSWKVASVKATNHRVVVHPSGGCLLWFDTPIFAAPYSLTCHLALGRIEKRLSVG